MKAILYTRKIRRQKHHNRKWRIKQKLSKNRVVECLYYDVRSWLKSGSRTFNCIGYNFWGHFGQADSGKMSMSILRVRNTRHKINNFIVIIAGILAPPQLQR